MSIERRTQPAELPPLEAEHQDEPLSVGERVLIAVIGVLALGVLLTLGYGASITLGWR